MRKKAPPPPPSADVTIVTSDGESIAAHSAILVSESPVLQRMVERSRRGWSFESTIQILGVTSSAVVAFVQFLYFSRAEGREAEEAMEKEGMRLLALGHAYRVGWLKRAAEAAVVARLVPERVVDAAKLASLCDAPRLWLACVRLAEADFAAVCQSEGWAFLHRHDPALELAILQSLEDADQRKKRWRRERAAQEVYQQLSEAMDCLQHIFAEGCTKVGLPGGGRPSHSKDHCARVHTCQGLKHLIRHFATCVKKLGPAGGCHHCRRMYQLLRLHSYTCNRQDLCSVPLCNQLKKMEMEGKVDKRWRLLAKKVAGAKVMCSLAGRKRPEETAKASPAYRK